MVESNNYERVFDNTECLKKQLMYYAPLPGLIITPWSVLLHD